MSDEAFNKHMERKHPTRHLTIQESRTAEEERAWEEQQKKKAIRQLKRQILRDREEDRTGYMVTHRLNQLNQPLV